MCPVGAQLFQASGWTDMMTLTVSFHNFRNTTKISSIKASSLNLNPSVTERLNRHYGADCGICRRKHKQITSELCKVFSI